MYLSRSGRNRSLQGRVASVRDRFKVQDMFKVKEAEAMLEDWWGNGIWSGVGSEGIHNAIFCVAEACECVLHWWSSRFITMLLMATATVSALCVPSTVRTL